MIVKCERCQTRFKIPDEKVTDKGVKVRCTKCQHTFRVVREDVASGASAPGAVSPEAASSAKPPATPRVGTPLEVPRASVPGASSPMAPGSASLQARPPARPAGAPKGAPMDPPRTPSTLDLDPLMEFIGEHTPTPAEALKLSAKAPLPNKPAGAVALGPAQPKPAPAPKPARSPASAPVPAKSSAPALPVSSAPFSFDENDPFGSTDSDATLAGSVPTLPPTPAPRSGPVPVPVRSAPQAPVPKPAPSPVPVPLQVPTKSPAPAQRGGAPMAFNANDPFALPAEDSPTVPATPTLPPRGAAPAPAPVFEEMEGLEGNNPFVSFDAAPTVSATPTLPPAPAPKPARSAMGGFEGDSPFGSFDPVASLPPAPAANGKGGPQGDSPFGSFDPVASLPPAPAGSPGPSPAPAASGIPDWGAPQQGSAPSGIPDWGAPQGAVPAGIPDWGAPQTVAATPIAKANAPTERHPFPDFPGPGGAPQSREVLQELPAARPAPPPPVIAAQPAKKDAAPGQQGQGSRLVQRLAAVAAQLLVAAVLVVGLVAVGSAWLNDGRVELSALTPSRMREMVSPTRPLVAKDLSNGLYEVRGGQDTLFFVRGEVENRGTTPVRVKAGVVLYEGDQRVQAAQGIAGAVPTPEELYSLQDAKEAAALRARLDAAAKEIAPGARAPFVVFFYEYPKDLGNFRLEVTLEPQVKEGTAGNAQP